MKEINPNYWAPHNDYGAPNNDYLWDAPIPITNPPIANGDTLYHSFHVYYAGMFYYTLTLFAKGDFYEDN
jgi:hypothetical protein